MHNLFPRSRRATHQSLQLSPSGHQPSTLTHQPKLGCGIGVGIGVASQKSKISDNLSRLTIRLPDQSLVPPHSSFRPMTPPATPSFLRRLQTTNNGQWGMLRFVTRCYGSKFSFRPMFTALVTLVTDPDTQAPSPSTIKPSTAGCSTSVASCSATCSTSGLNFDQ
jgi:hypothetical protein